jgi:hypothetical protein
MKCHSKVWEFTVFDKDIDIEVYFYNEDDTDEWDKAMNIFAKKLTVIETDGMDGEYVTVDMSDVISKNINNGVFSKLFISNNTYDIMYDMEAILAGNVSEQWMTDFAGSLI